MASLHVYLLGTFHVLKDGVPIYDFRSDKVRALLAYLAVEAERPHRREMLAALLWPEAPDEVARRNLRLTLHRLRQALGDLDPFFVVTPEGVQCRGDRVWVDARAFEATLVAVEHHAHEALRDCSFCVARLTQAANLYRGDFLAGFSLRDALPFSEWVILKRERWHRLALHALYHLAEHHRQAGNLSEAERYAMRQVELEPWREEAHRQLMMVLAYQGEISAALAQYERCRKVLAEELHVAPSAATERLYRRLRLARDRPRHNLPPTDTPFVGRKAERERLRALLRHPSCRLVTILGAPGIGKTRFALEVAAALVPSFLHGVCYVPLADVASPTHLPFAVAEALGIRVQGGRDPRDVLLRNLREWELLLVLDNFEHLLGPDAASAHEARQFVDTLLRHAPDVKVLVTSRQRLGLHAEWAVVLAGLPYPDTPSIPGERAIDAGWVTAYPALELFLTRARQVRWDFAPDEEWPFIVRICQCVEGLPLGIELAAAWVDHLSCQEIATRIEQDLRFLHTSQPDMDPRHRSVWAAFEHSWRLLSEAEQRAFCCLSVFRDGFTLDAVREALGIDAALLTALVDKSLVRRVAPDRYGMHDLLREFARQKLAAIPGEREAVEARHATYYLTLVGRWAEACQGPGVQAALSVVQHALHNVQAAWAWAVRHRQPALLEQALETLYHFYEIRGRFREGEQIFGEAAHALEHVPAGTAPAAEVARVRGKLLNRHAFFCWRIGRYDAGHASAQVGLALARETGMWSEAGLALSVLGLIAHNQGEYALARQRYQQSLNFYRRAGDRSGTARALVRMGLLLYTLEAYEAAQEVFQNAFTLAEAVGDERASTYIRAYLGLVAAARGAHEEARRWCQEALQRCGHLGDAYGAALCHLYLGQTFLQMQAWVDAHRSLEAAWDAFRKMGDRHAMAYTCRYLGDLHRLREAYTEAGRWYRESLALYQEIGNPNSAADVLAALGQVALLQGRPDEARRRVKDALMLVNGHSHAAFYRHWQDLLRRLGLGDAGQTTPNVRQATDVHSEPR